MTTLSSRHGRTIFPLTPSLRVARPPAQRYVSLSAYGGRWRKKNEGLLTLSQNPYVPIYQSLDQGQTWSERSRVYDTQNGWGLRYQPELHELTEKIGDFEPGTLVLATNSIPADLNGTRIDIYVSQDEGYVYSRLCLLRDTC